MSFSNIQDGSCMTEAVSSQLVRQFSKPSEAQSNIRSQAGSKVKLKSALSESAPKPEYEVIFKFPYIVHMRALSRLKIFQTGITVVIIPAIGYLTLAGSVSSEVFTYSFGIAMLAGVMLYVMSSFFRRMIGLISTNQDSTIVKISHMNFWGQRVNILVPTESIVPFSEYESNPGDIFVKFLRYDTDTHLYMSLKFGGIIDKEKFSNVFGVKTLSLSKQS